MGNEIEVTDEDRKNATLACKAYRSVRRDTIQAIAELFAKVRAATSTSPLTAEQVEAIARSIQVNVIERTGASGKYVSDIVSIIKRHLELMTVATEELATLESVLAAPKG